MRVNRGEEISMLPEMITNTACTIITVIHKQSHLKTDQQQTQSLF